MDNKKEHKRKDYNKLKNIKMNEQALLSAECPFCHSNIAIILDYKKIESQTSDWLCLVCGQVFEYERRE